MNNSTATLDYMRQVRTVFCPDFLAQSEINSALEVNGIRLDCTNDEVVEVGLAVASGAMDGETLLERVRVHRV